ncbi:hypothetical protein XELAEV_18002179mg [Xenopus laevis]|nr:hypothetical protein XELAEV_18002179mg [Xenopus laevis]
MKKYFGLPNRKPQRKAKQKPNEKKMTQDPNPTDSETETITITPSRGPNESTWALVGQKLDSIKESVLEILQQITNQNQKLTEAKQRISTLGLHLQISKKFTKWQKTSD